MICFEKLTDVRKNIDVTDVLTCCSESGCVNLLSVQTIRFAKNSHIFEFDETLMRMLW